MTASKREDAERRDAVLRRMLATPKPGKGEKKGGEPKPAAPRPTSSEKGASKRVPTR